MSEQEQYYESDYEDEYGDITLNFTADAANKPQQPVAQVSAPAAPPVGSSNLPQSTTGQGTQAQPQYQAQHTTTTGAAAGAPQVRPLAPGQPQPSTLPAPDESVYEVDLNSFAEKPWSRPGADITEYFNYGFNEETWRHYCSEQVKRKRELNSGRWDRPAGEGTGNTGGGAGGGRGGDRGGDRERGGDRGGDRRNNNNDNNRNRPDEINYGAPPPPPPQGGLPPPPPPPPPHMGGQGGDRERNRNYM